MAFRDFYKSGLAAAVILPLLSGCMQTQPAGQAAHDPGQDNHASASAALVRVNTPTQIRGLAVVVNFTDIQANRTEAQYSAMLNQPNGFTADGNNGSLSEYYRRQSNGRVNLSYEVVSVNMVHPHDYYINTDTWDGGQALAQDVIAAVKAKYPNGFTGLTSHPTENRIWFMGMMVAWNGGGGSNYGVDANANVGIKNNGVNLPVGVVNLTNFDVNSPASINTITHETGHNLFEWTDYYYYRTDSSTVNLGHYCLMGSGGNASGGMPINPGLRYQQGWIDTVVEISKTARTTYTVAANSTTKVFKYTNPKDPNEYYLIEALRHGDYYVAIDGDGLSTDEGLAIWYVHEAYASFWPFLRVKLVQADHRDDMSHPESNDHNALRGDMTDLFDNVSNTFDEAGYPLFGWKDGSATNLRIVDISAPGATMAFTVVPPDAGVSLPGRIEAEAYKAGGEGIGYHDLTAGNTGGQFRTDNVDIQATSDAGGGYNVGWTQAGEWLAYDAKVATAGTYKVTARMASGAAGTKTATLLIDGAPAGTFSLTAATGWQAWNDVVLTGVNLTAGNHAIRINLNSNDINLNYLAFDLAPDLIALPGRIQAEAYNAGGEGAGYHDLSIGNSGGQFRTDNVDIEATSDAGGGYNVGWTQAGEWLAYGVNVATAGSYQLTARLASGVAGTKTIAVLVDGAQVGAFSSTDASGWQSWKDVVLTGINLTAGNHVIRLNLNADGLNVNYVDVQKAVVSTEILANGNFADGLAGWSTQTQNTAAATFPVDAGSAKISITATGVQSWEIQIFQQVSLAAGRTYKLEFDVKGEAIPKNFKVVVEHNAEPWTKTHDQQYAVTAAANTWQHFAITFTQPVADAAVRVGFHFGANNTNDAWIDNASLKLQ